jgi:hypothetical protein
MRNLKTFLLAAAIAFVVAYIGQTGPEASCPTSNCVPPAQRAACPGGSNCAPVLRVACPGGVGCLSAPVSSPDRLSRHLDRRA